MLSPLQKIAIHQINTDDDRINLTRWWSRKYNKPTNHPLLLSLTWEELYLEYFFDHYSNNPKSLEEAEKEIYKVKEWSGDTSEEYEEEIKARIKSKHQVDLSQWRSEDIQDDEIDDVYVEGNNDT